MESREYIDAPDLFTIALAAAFSPLHTSDHSAYNSHAAAKGRRRIVRDLYGLAVQYDK